MAAYTWGNLLQLLAVTVWFCGLLMISLSTPALDYPSHNAKIDYIVNNPGAVTACEAAAIGGNSSCVTDDLYTSRAWKPWEWYVLYFTLPLALVVTFFTVVYLLFQKYGFFWFLAAAFWAGLFIWLLVVVIFTTIYWINCKDYTACSNARFVYADLLGFGGEVSHSTANWWIVHLVGHYVLFLSLVALVVATIATQCCLSFAANGRDYGLDPLFTSKDKQRLLEANRVDAAIDAESAPAMSSAGSPLDGIVPAQYLHSKRS